MRACADVRRRYERPFAVHAVQSEVDTKTKVFTIHTEDTQAEGLLSGTYDYSIEKDTLTLTEREYGDQLVFVKREKK